MTQSKQIWMQIDQYVDIYTLVCEDKMTNCKLYLGTVRLKQVFH
jgi:hypothetical protein